jgi:hypothetical protein
MVALLLPLRSSGREALPATGGGQLGLPDLLQVDLPILPRSSSGRAVAGVVNQVAFAGGRRGAVTTDDRRHGSGDRHTRRGGSKGPARAVEPPSNRRTFLTPFLNLFGTKNRKGLPFLKMRTELRIGLAGRAVTSGKRKEGPKQGTLPASGPRSEGPQETVNGPPSHYV